jgi:mRNA interferase MazF
LRGDIWLADLGATRGHEQAGVRPVAIISTDLFNSGAARLAVVVPLTTTERHVRWHVPISPQPDGVQRTSFIKCEDIRSVSTDRLLQPLGRIDEQTMREVERRLRYLLQL